MDAYDWLKLILVMGATFLITGIIMAAGGYFMVRLLAAKFNSRRDELEQAAKSLGLEVDRAGEHILAKPLVGLYDKHKVEVLSFRQPTGRYSYVGHVSCEVF